jgi:hypothetical protein
MTRRINLFLSTVALGALLTLCPGCGANEPTSSYAAEAAAQVAPGFNEVDKALELDDADAAVMKAALAEWKRSASAQKSGTPGFVARRGEMEFIATVAPTLDDAQLESLVTLLVSKHEVQREERRGQHRGMHSRNGDYMQAMAKELGLSDKQRDQLKSLHEETRTKSAAQRDAFKKGSISEDQMRDALGVIRADAHQKMASILSDQQMKKLDSMRDERFANRVDRRVENAENRNDTHLAWLVRTFELTDAQASQVKAAMNKQSGAQESALKAVQAGSITREQAHEQMRAAHATFAQALQAILTAQQAQRMEILRPLLPGRIHHA